MYSLTTPEARQLKLRCGQGWILAEAQTDNLSQASLLASGDCRQSTVSLDLQTPHSDPHLCVRTAFCLCVSVLSSCKDTSLWIEGPPYSRTTSA